MVVLGVAAGASVLLGTIGSAAGFAIAGGIFFAVVDGRASYFAFKEGENFLGTQYAVATVVGSLATGTGVWALFRTGLAPNLATFVLTVAYIGLQYYIVKTKMEPIQKAIKESPWGIEPDNKKIGSRLAELACSSRAFKIVNTMVG